MRTTLTLDPDVAEQLKKAVAKGDQTFKDVVNAALRRGLKASDTSAPKKRFVQRTWNGGGMLMSMKDAKLMLYDKDEDDLS